LAYSLRGVKNYNKGKSEGKDFGLMTGRKKKGAFFRQGVLQKMYEKEAMRKKKNEKG
jgi:hypothetical protein